MTVLRDGVTVLNEPRAAIDEQKLIVAIVGREAALAGVNRSDVRARNGRAPILTVSGLSSPAVLTKSSSPPSPARLSDWPGSSAPDAAKSCTPSLAPIRPRAVASSSRAGPCRERSRPQWRPELFWFPEDRIRQALFVDESIRWNTTLPNPAPVSALGLFPIEALEEQRADDDHLHLLRGCAERRRSGRRT